MITIVAFILEFLCFNVAFSLSFFFLLITVRERYGLKGNRQELLLISFGTGPILSSLLLFFLLLVLPGMYPWVYVILLLTAFAVPIYLYGGNYILLMWRYVRLMSPIRGKVDIKLTTKNINLNIGYRWQTLLFLAAVYFFARNWLMWLSKYDIVGHDMLEYAFQGKLFAKALSVDYQPFRFDQGTYFYYVGLHGFGFPLLSTLEIFFDSIFGLKKDLYFRSVTGYYGFMTLLLMFNLLRKRNFVFALVFPLITGITAGFYIMLREYHIDMLRIFLFSASMLMLFRALKSDTRIDYMIFGLFAGLHAFVHSTGVFIAIFGVLSVLLFTQSKKIERIKLVGWTTLSIMVFGGIHYVLDVFIGTGWLFQQINFY